MSISTSPLAAKTRLLYQYEESIRKHTTRVAVTHRFGELSGDEKALFKTGNEHTHVLELYETIFYVQGGGQPFDTGTISSISHDQQTKNITFVVEAVRYCTNGRVLHFGHFASATDTAFQDGDTVHLNLDSPRRDLNSRIHTAGHIIGLAVRELASQTPELDVSELKAQHYPDASFVEFRGLIDGKFKDSIQAIATEMVGRAMPVKLYWYLPEELETKGVIMAEGMPVIAGPDGNVRVVDIEGAGAYPCGGTHVPHTGAVSRLLVRGIKRQKGISKVGYAPG